MFYLSYKNNSLINDPKPTRFPTISVIIPVLNELNTVKGTIDSIKKASLNYPSKIEIIVVDDGSTDGTYEMLEPLSKSKEISLYRNVVKSKGLNVNYGVNKSNGELIAVIDADTFVDRDIFNSMVGYLEDDNVGSVFANVVSKNKGNLIELYQEREYTLVSFIRQALASMNAMSVTPGGGFPMYKRDVFLSIGGYCGPEILTEDMEIAIKLIRKGYVIRVSKSAKSYTRVPSTLYKLFRQRVRWYRGTLQTFKKYPDMLFNKNYNILGLFILPMFFFLFFATSMIYLGIILGLYGEIFNFIMSTLTLIKIGYFPNLFNFDLSILNPFFLIDPMTIFIIISFFVWWVLIYEGMKISDKSIDINFFLAFISIIIYSPIIFLCYFVAFYEEIMNRPNRWW